MRDVERREKLEKISLYRNNQVAYLISLLAVISELCYAIAILDVITRDTRMFFVVVINIILLFATFYIAVQEKVYRPKAAYIAIAIAAYFAVRIFYIVPAVLKPESRIGWIRTFDVCSIFLLVFAALKTIDISKRRSRHIMEEQ